MSAIVTVTAVYTLLASHVAYSSADPGGAVIPNAVGISTASMFYNSMIFLNLPIVLGMYVV